MFSKTADPTSAPAVPPVPRPATPASNAARSLIATDLRITGEMTTTGAIEVLGEIDGNITANGLIIGDEGRVKGTVSAQSVEVKGRLEGKVGSESFTLRSSAKVKADVRTAGVVIESGAEIEGRFLKPKG